MKKFHKDPNATLDYSINWEDWLAGDTITVSNWSATAGITIVNNFNTATSTSVWLSGGSIGNSYSTVNTITTATGRTDERTLTINVVNK